VFTVELLQNSYHILPTGFLFDVSEYSSVAHAIEKIGMTVRKFIANVEKKQWQKPTLRILSFSDLQATYIIATPGERAKLGGLADQLQRYQLSRALGD
jgi:hypothetical protein